MSNNKVPFTWIDWALSAAIAGLSIELLALLWEPAIGAWLNRPRPGAQVAQQFLAGQGIGADAATPIDYLLYLPPYYDASAKWPLVVFLHGAGDRGEDLERVRRAGLPRIIEQDKGRHWGFVLVSPQCPEESYWDPKQVIELVEHVSGHFSIDQDRVYLTGHSMGGYGTWATACHDPDRFAAIAPLSGGGDLRRAERLKGLPVRAFHGNIDHVVPIDGDQAMVDAVRKAGGDVVFTIYGGAGHGICDITYSDNRFYEWLLAQRRKRATGSGGAG